MLVNAVEEGRNPLTGLSGLQQEVAETVDEALGDSRNPLTGLSGLQPKAMVEEALDQALSRNPLTGLSGLQPSSTATRSSPSTGGSQSPYGAKWFATFPGLNTLAAPQWLVAIPLRG